ncbi:hypothetical protein DQ241_17690 [Blastococcus sp. TF02A-30]|nr:hypothetical protein DQ241_17690 [Blastococcus sp. TF02A-30]
MAEAVAQFEPDLVVGIETGGARVAEAMVDGLGSPQLVGVRVQRPATKLKSRMSLGRLFSRLPRGVVDLLRWAEVEMREATLRSQGSSVESGARALLATSALQDAATGARRVLIVDDTIDSGRTLSVVKRAVELAEPAAEIRTAVLASTWRRPPVQPDYCLYGRCLLRMPWSFDAERP